SVPANQTTDIYLKVNTDGPMIAPVIFWEEKPLTKNILQSHSIMAMYLGLVIVLSIYNLILFFNIRDSAYLFYTLHLLCICWFQASMMGYTAMYLWEDKSSYLLYLEPPIVSSLSVAIIFQFTRRFLRIDQVSPALDRLLSLGTYSSLVFVVVVVTMPLKFVITTMFAGFFMCVLTLVFTGVYAFRRGVRSARYFLLGWGLLIAGSVIQNNMYQNILPFNFFTMQSVLFASGLEAILMSIALADRINLMRQKKSAAHREALESAEQSNNLKDQFLATISHELRTPMNGVLGALELVDHNALKAEDKHAIQVARLSSRRMLTLINGLLNYTEAQLEDTQVNKRAFRLPHDVKDLVDHLQQSCASRHLKTHVSTNIKESDEFYGDIEKIRTVILHLTENALKFTTEGSIAMAFNVEQDSAGDQQRCQLVMRIQDTGEGICKERQQEIFDAFSQLDAEYTRKHGGLGIGLALVKRLVTIMGGQVDLSSIPGKGTCFEVRLPVDRFTGHDTAKPQNLAYIHQNQEPFILIAEDNEVNQKILAALCSKLGYRSIVAVNGEAAVTIAKQVSPALIFMDCQMPIMDGFEATRKIRLLNKAMHSVPIIAVTANASSKDQQRCFEAGMNDHITKPISLNSIQGCLLRWLPKQQHLEPLTRATESGS
ncbi:MAG: 7TM diverse intracellular signaling domain-containing protein, partial [Ketobacteraceae bacterium]|nr:7TM diverse intracellular signaling domain-containing protein [Ketobacteraceae bacterium]